MFQQCSFFVEFHILQIFLPPKHPFILRSSFLLTIRRFMRFSVKCNTFKSLKMANPRWHMLSVPFLVINYVIMTSLPLLKIILSIC